MSAPQATQKELLARIAERTDIHYNEFMEFKDSMLNHLDKIEHRVRSLENSRTWLTGVMGVLWLLGYAGWEWSKASLKK